MEFKMGIFNQTLKSKLNKYSIYKC